MSPNILIGCTGSVATIKLPLLLQQLSENRHLGTDAHFKVVLTQNARHFLRARNEEIARVAQVYGDEDEWSTWNQVSDPVLHIELRRWADLMVIAPLDANTLAKIAGGLCDNLLTCVVRAWDPSKPLLFCPAMNTYMWDHPLTGRHVSSLEAMGYRQVPCVLKRLACGDLGYGAMAEVPSIVDAVITHLPNQWDSSAVTLDSAEPE